MLAALCCAIRSIHRSVCVFHAHAGRGLVSFEAHNSPWRPLSLGRQHIELMLMSTPVALDNGVSKPRRRRSGVVPTELKSPEARATAVLALLRRDHSMADFTVVVDEVEIPIHSGVVATMSPFFATALSGDFAEASQRRMVIGDACVNAVRVVLDFGYGLDIHPALRNGRELAWRVWALAHRFEIGALSEIAGSIVIENEPIGKSVEIFRQSRWYSCKSVEKRMLTFIRVNLHRVAEASPDFNELTHNELVDILNSGRDSFPLEFNKYRAVKMWALHKKEERVRNLGEIFEHIRFETFSRSEFDIFEKDIEMMPKKILLNALRRSSQAVKEVRRQLENRRQFYDGQDDDDDDEGSPYSF